MSDNCPSPVMPCAELAAPCPRRYRVFLLDPCAEECTCTDIEEDGKCLANEIVKWLEEQLEPFECKSARTFESGSKLLNFEFVTEWADKMVVLWNKRALKCAEKKSGHEVEPMETNETSASDDPASMDIESSTKDEKESSTDENESLKRFKYYYQCADYVQVDKGEGNFLIHVRLEKKSVPDYVNKWENVIESNHECREKLHRRILEQSLELKDISPSSALAYGLASTFLMGYLRKKVKAVAAYAETQKNENGDFYPKLIIVVPKSGLCLNLLPGVPVKGKLPMTCNAGGVTNRKYGTSIYEVMSSPTKILAAIEYATPVRALYKMSCATKKSQDSTGEVPKYLPSIGGMSHYWRRGEIMMFYCNLMEMIKTDESTGKHNYNDHCDFILFDDLEHKDIADENNYKALVQDQLKEQILAVMELNSSS